MSIQNFIKLAEYRPDQPFTVLIPPYTVLLKDGETTATIYPIHDSEQLPPGLLAFLADEFNMEIERGDTLPFFETLDIEEFKQYWFGSFAAVMVLGEDQQLDHQRQWEKECLGTFFIRNNFPGRSSHISTGGFLVNAGIRGKGIGRTLAECFLDWAPKLGYTSCMFNLVFETNVGARKIFESLDFKRIGKIKAAGILKEHESAVDAYIYGKELVHTVEPLHGTYRFEKIKYYLQTGRYPPMIDRQEKSRLRSASAKYRVVDNKLLLRGRECVGDPMKQLEICTEYHRVAHGGINKTTNSVSNRYHWPRIKDTVAQAIRNCAVCRDPVNRRRESPEAPQNKTTSTTTTTPHVTVHHHSTTTSHNSRNEAGTNPHQQQDFGDLVNDHATPRIQQHHRAHDNLEELTNLDIPSGILAAVEKAQRMHEQESSRHTPGNQTQSTESPHDQQVETRAEPQSQHSDHRNSVTARDYAGSTSPDQYINNNHDNIHIEHDHNGAPHVDPDLGGFDSQGQSGSEIEIARALINANGANNGQEGDGDEDLFH